jgi:hypothetical protein
MIRRIPVFLDLCAVDPGFVNPCVRVWEDDRLILGMRMVVVVGLLVEVVMEEERFVVDGGMTDTEQEDTPVPTPTPSLSPAPPSSHPYEAAPSSPSPPPPSSQPSPSHPFPIPLDPF